jgi:hypothetical protein
VFPAVSVSIIVGRAICVATAGCVAMPGNALGPSTDERDMKRPASAAVEARRLAGRNPTPVSGGAPGEGTLETALRFSESAASAKRRRRMGSAVGSVLSLVETADVG